MKAKCCQNWFGNIGQYKTGKKLDLWSRPLITVSQQQHLQPQSKRHNIQQSLEVQQFTWKRVAEMKHIMTTLFGCNMIMVQLKNVKS